MAAPPSSSEQHHVLVPGQRWVSEAEPELGLGIVITSAGRRVVVEFPAAGTRREYALEGAPIRRVRFRPGDSVTSRDGGAFTIRSVRDDAQLVAYETVEGRELAEADLSDALPFATPDERLLAGHWDSSRLFDLRREALENEHRRRGSPVRGFLGGRIELIPHQISIAAAVTARQAPRVLLADEVGLGKAIEACLIVHRLLETGRAAHVLIVVPEALVHQWFVELLRRFDLHFTILDETSWRREDGRPVEGNPFEDQALVLCALALLRDRERAGQAVAAGWDVLVVDEAHRLRWSPAQASPEYRVVEALSRRASAVLLLTATPEQLGLPGHFARLRLLDPARYGDFPTFEREAERFREVARVANLLLRAGPLAGSEIEDLRAVLGQEPGAIRERLEALALGGTRAREALVADLVDRHGPGRAVFRNTRAVVKGFPERLPRPAPLPAPTETPALLSVLAREIADDLAEEPSSSAHDFARDPRIVWLADLLRQLRPAKVLLICRTPAKVRAIQAALERHSNVRAALFHEDLDLIQRDRQAAWFGEADGPTILLASEIGSEGRNFQFAHHLVLFDLPLDPELLEQRIGRLDRIGQTQAIHIHVPYVEDSPQEVLFRWYDEALDAFARHQPTGRVMLETFETRVKDVVAAFRDRAESRRALLAELIQDTRAARLEQEQRLERSRDRLLELGSFRPKVAGELIETIRALDADSSLDESMERLWEHYGVAVEEIATRTYVLRPESAAIDSFPGLPARGLTVTLDRRRALAREDLAFLTWDHPMVTGALDLLLGSRDGNAAVASWASSGETGFWLDVFHVLECVAPAALHVDRFLPATPIRTVLDARAADVTSRALALLHGARLAEVSPYALRGCASIERSQLAHLLAAALRLADAQRAERVAAAVRAAQDHFDHEIERHRALAAVNPAVRPDELAALEREREELRQGIAGARLRLDSLRLILHGTP